MIGSFDLIPTFKRHGPMLDESLRLPTRRFQAIFNLGQLHLTVGQRSAVSVTFFGTSDPELSPWAQDETVEVVTFAVRLVARLRRISTLPSSVAKAVDWFEHGHPIYVPETGPTNLQVIDVEVPGQLMMLPWLGAGHVDYRCNEAVRELVWGAWAKIPSTVIARARDDEDGRSTVVAADDADWDAVGCDPVAAARWFAAVHDNHAPGRSPAEQIMQRTLERVTGLS